MDKGINAEMVVLGITTQTLLVLVRAWPRYCQQVTTYLFVKTLQTIAAVSKIMRIPISFLGPVLPTSQPQAACACKGNGRLPVRKSQKGSLLLESVARMPLGKEKSWS